MTMLHARTAVCTIALLCAPLCTTSLAAAMLGADQGSGYSGLILEKVAKTWQAPQYPSDHSVRILVRIDGNGEVLDCTPVQSSNLALLDKSACAAVREIKKYPLPPYGMPIDVYLTFWTGLPSVSNLSPEPAKVASAAQATRNEQQAASSTAAALALARAAEARAAAASKGAANRPNAPAQVSPGTSLSPRGTPPATPVTTATSKSATKGANPKASATKATIAKENPPKDNTKPKSTKGGASTLSADASDRATVLITKSPSDTKTATSKNATAKGTSESSASTQKGSTQAESREVATAASSDSADTSTSGGRIVLPVPAKSTKPAGNLVGTNAEEPTAPEGRYARQVRWTIREAMLIPAELPVGEYTFTIYVRLSDTGEITKAEMTHSSDNPLMDKYAMRGIKRVKELPPPPSKKLHDLHLTFVVQRS